MYFYELGGFSIDALTHGIVGLAIAGLSGTPFSANEPIYWATLLGSQAPDFDIIAVVRGSFNYLKKHRAFSHSVLGSFIWSLMISVCLYPLFPAANTLLLFGWAFAGCLSHIVLDFLNTHGSAILWPLCKKRLSAKLLNVFDPILLLLLFLPHLLKVNPYTSAIISIAILALYVLIRVYLRERTRKQLSNYIDLTKTSQVTLMPSHDFLLYWDFVVETSDRYLVGHISSLKPRLQFSAKLNKQDYTPIIAHLNKTDLGHFFSNFTPFPFICCHEERASNNLIINVYDLRYMSNQEFVHRATIVLNNTLDPISSYLYSYGRKIEVPC